MQRTERGRWRIPVVESRKVGKRRFRFKQLIRGLDQMSDHRVLLEFLGVRFQVKPHQKSGEGEYGEAGVFLNLPAGLTLDSVADGPEDFRHV